MITIEDFAKIELKVGTIIAAQEIDGSEKLLKLQVDFGELVIPANAGIQITEKVLDVEESTIEDTEIQDSEQVGMTGNDQEKTEIVTKEAHQNDKSVDLSKDIRQVLSGIKQWYKPEDLSGKQFVFVTNLAPRKMMGMESQAMIMAAEGEDRPIPLTVSEKVPNGAKIR